MTLNTRDRSVLFESLSKLADPEAVDAMLAHFPTREVDEPLTRDYLDSRLIEFREAIRLAILTEFQAFDAKFASFRPGGDHRDRVAPSGDRSAVSPVVGQWTVRTMIALAALIVAAATLVMTLR